MVKTTLFALALGATVGFASVTQAAGPTGPATLLPDMGLVQQVHGCHRACERGPRGGWHYHVGRACVRMSCDANPGGEFRWHCEGPRCGWWHPREKRWH